MKCTSINNDTGILSMTKEEIDGIATSTFYLDEIEKRKNQDPIFFNGLSEFLVQVRNRFFQLF